MVPQTGVGGEPSPVLARVIAHKHICLVCVDALRIVPPAAEKSSRHQILLTCLVAVRQLREGVEKYKSGKEPPPPHHTHTYIALQLLMPGITNCVPRSRKPCSCDAAVVLLHERGGGGV